MKLRETLSHPEQMSCLIDILESAVGWGDMVPFSDYPNNDWPETGYMYQAFTSIWDRQEGRNYPLWRNEQDLKRHRATMRRFIGVSEVTEAITTALRVYTFGKGIDITTVAQPKVDVDPVLVENVRRVVDRFLTHNDFINSMDIEAHKRSIDDGETQIALEKDLIHPRQIYARFVEADNLTRPMAINDTEFYDYIQEKYALDLMSFVPNWEFGVLTPERQTDRVCGYYVQWDAGGGDWEFYSEEEFLHIKRNVSRNVKRGLSDWFAIKDRISQVGKLRTNTAHGAALQAAIAWIVEPPAGTTAGQLPSRTPNDLQYQAPTGIGSGGGTRTQKTTNYRPGSVVTTTPGSKYRPGPMGAERNEGFMTIDRMTMAACGSRFQMPYYMVSADSSDNNFASSLVAESPFVKTRESDQRFYATHYERLLWKVVRMAWRNGWLDLRGVPLSNLKELINIKVEFPSVATRDRTALVTQLVQEVDVLGVTSHKTAATELGRDYEEEIELGAKPIVAPATPTAPGKPVVSDPNQPSQTSSLEAQPELANSSARQFDRTNRAIQKILGQLKSGTMTRPHAKQMLLAIGMQDARAEALLDDAQGGGDENQLAAVESVLIEASHDVSGENRDRGKFSKGSSGGSSSKSKAAKPNEYLENAKLNTEHLDMSNPAEKRIAIIEHAAQARDAFDDGAHKDIPAIHREIEKLGGKLVAKRGDIQKFDNRIHDSGDHDALPGDHVTIVHPGVGIPFIDNDGHNTGRLVNVERSKVAPAESKPSKSKGVSAPTHDEILSAMHEIEPRVASGDVADVKSVRARFPGVGKEDFDKTMLKMYGDRKIILHRSSGHLLPPEERKHLVADPDDLDMANRPAHYNAVSLWPKESRVTESVEGEFTSSAPVSDWDREMYP